MKLEGDDPLDLRPRPLSRIAAEGLIEDEQARADLIRRLVADYDRRRSHWWGRFLLWLLRKTT